MHDDHAALIDQLGGGTVVAEALWGPRRDENDRRVESVYAWKKNGIAWKWRPAIAQLAEKCGVSLPPGFLPSTTYDAQVGTSMTAEAG